MIFSNLLEQRSYLLLKLLWQQDAFDSIPNSSVFTSYAAEDREVRGPVPPNSLRYMRPDSRERNIMRRALALHTCSTLQDLFDGLWRCNLLIGLSPCARYLRQCFHSLVRYGLR